MMIKNSDDRDLPTMRERLEKWATTPFFRPILFAASLSIVLLLGPTLPSSKFFSSPTDYLPLHTVLEFVAMAVSAMVFALGWNMRAQGANGRAVLLGCAALCVALIDLAHTLSYTGMPDFVSASSPEKAINFWLAGRFVAALSLIAVVYLPDQRWSTARCNSTLALALATAALVWWIGLFHADLLPRTFIPGQGLTPAKILAEYCLASFYALAALGLARQVCRQRQVDTAWLAAAAWVLGLAELFFTLYRDVSDLFNLLGHLYKTVAYLMIYRAVFVAGVAAPYAQLQESERRLSNAMHASGEGLWDWQIDHDQVSHNAHWFQFLGRSPNTASHSIQAFAEIVHEEDRPHVMAAIKACLNGEGRYHCEYRLRHADGHYLWVMDSGDVVERAADGRPRRMAGSVRDITELRGARQALETYRDHLEELVAERTHELEVARTEAERLTRVKSSFIANMSHEIRTPMNAILGMAHFMRRDGVTPRQAQQLDKIDAASKHLLSIINDILDLSKIEAGKLELEERELSVSELVANIAAIISPNAEEKGLQFVVDCEQLPYSVLGDSTRLTQALLNLANNAIKFTEAGKIVIRVRQTAQAEGVASLKFEIEDTGIGIDESQQARLFDPFEQADASTTRQYGGTGLGLAITRHLVHLMGGEIGFTSKPGVGSQFWFTAKLKKGTEIPPADAAMPEPTEQEWVVRLASIGHGCRILVAEDEPINQFITLELLAGTGITLDVANDGFAAVEKVRAQHYDLILMDMQMPRMDGLEATSLIRKIPGKEHTPIVAVTANAFSQDRERCVAIGMQDFIAKPITPLVFYATVFAALSRSRQAG